MKKYTIIIVFMLCIANMHAQKITEKKINFSGKESIALNIQITDSINIHTWNKNEVYVKSSVNINDNKDNDAYRISFDETGKLVIIKASFIDNFFKGKQNCIESDIWWDVYIPEKTGFTVETINGDITIKGKTDMMKVKTISGYIDLAVPSDKAADLELSTITGTVYTDHNFTFTRSAGGIPSVIKEKMNNGGPGIKLETISGDIFFRRSN